MRTLRDPATTTMRDASVERWQPLRTPESPASASSVLKDDANTCMLPWHLVAGSESVHLSAPRSMAPLAPVTRTPLFCSSSACLPWHIQQDVHILLERFIDEERERVTTVHEPWRPLRCLVHRLDAGSSDGVKSVAALPPIRALRSTFESPIVDKTAAVRPASFETMLRLHYLKSNHLISDAGIAAMLTAAEPVLRDAQARHRLWQELGWDARAVKAAVNGAEEAKQHRRPCRSSCQPPPLRKVQCRIEGHWPFPIETKTTS